MNTIHKLFKPYNYNYQNYKYSVDFVNYIIITKGLKTRDYKFEDGYEDVNKYYDDKIIKKEYLKCEEFIDKEMVDKYLTLNEFFYECVDKSFVKDKKELDNDFIKSNMEKYKTNNPYYYAVYSYLSTIRFEDDNLDYKLDALASKFIKYAIEAIDGDALKEFSKYLKGLYMYGYYIDYDIFSESRIINQNDYPNLTSIRDIIDYGITNPLLGFYLDGDLYKDLMHFNNDNLLYDLNDYLDEFLMELTSKERIAFQFMYVENGNHRLERVAELLRIPLELARRYQIRAYYKVFSNQKQIELLISILFNRIRYHNVISYTDLREYLDYQHISLFIALVKNLKDSKFKYDIGNEWIYILN